MNKVFCIGIYKTGTTSVGRAFEQLGLRTFHGGYTKLELGNDTFNWSAEDFAPFRSQIRNLVSLYDAFEDFPFMWIYKELHEDYPDAKFILTERDSVKVARSDINMWKQLRRSPIPTEQKFIDRYEKHNKAVTDYFKNSSQLLRIILGEGNEWQKIGDFLDLPVPSQIPFPRANVRPYGFFGRALFRVGRPIRNTFRSR